MARKHRAGGRSGELDDEGLPLGVLDGGHGALLAGVAARLGAAGWRVAGAVQHNRDAGPGQPCDMDLHILGSGARVRISQRLGPASTGCRLDAGGLEHAVGLVEAALGAGAQIVIVNKFGKQEAEGRGFRPLIARALAEGVPVLTSVDPAQRAAFDAFAGGLARDLPGALPAVLAWCGTAAGLPVAPAPAP